jgi:glyoxylase-like metal-dependent hydrolase (beta-lactamase superfamily II)
MSPPAPDRSRRHFVAAALAGLPALASVTSHARERAASPPATPSFRQPFVYRFSIGSMEAWSISDCDLAFREGLDLMHPESARPAMREEMIRHGESLDSLPLYVNLLVVRSGGAVALFDAGFGQGKNPRMGWLKDGLAAVGISPEQVTTGFLSHAHADHLNGFVDAGKPAFPNAVIHLLEEELAFWRSPEPDFSKSRRDPKGIPGMIREVRANFDILGKQLEPVKAGTTLFGGQVTIEAAPGHTAGHACFRLRSDREELLHLMDLAHHHLLMFAKPEWNIAFDHDPDLAIRSRQCYWADTSAKHTRCFGFHLPWPGLGHIIQATPEQYRWWPERWQWQG